MQDTVVQNVSEDSKIKRTVTYTWYYVFIQWTTSKIWDQKLFRHFDLTKFYLSVFSFISNATFLDRWLNKIKHFLVICWPELV